MGIAREKKKKTLKAKMLGILTMCAMTSLLAAGNCILYGTENDTE